jgi:hypothetical protein
VAVTQQIARLTIADLEDCRRSVAAINRLCSFKARGSEDYLDLDWSPSPLLKSAAVSGLPPELIEAVERACAGETEINPGFRDAPDTIWEHPVSALEPDDVQTVASRLAQWHGADVVGGLASAADDAAEQVGMIEFAEHPAAYLRRHYDALSAFYVEAARRRLATAMWWD